MNADLRRADETLLDLAWSLWSSLGVSSWMDPDTDVVVEVEPLLAFTAFVGKDDRRLLREVTSWVVEQMPLLSLRQFKNVVTTQRWPFEGSINELGAVLAEATGKAWPGKGERGVDLPAGERPATVDLTAPCALQLRLRAIFGVSSRAEILRILLLSARPLTVSELSERVAYTRRQIDGDIDPLISAGLLVDVSSPGPLRVSLARPDLAEGLFGPTGHDVDWAPAFRLLTGLRQLLQGLAAQEWTEPSAELARQLRRLEPQRVRVGSYFEPPTAAPGSVADAIDRLASSISSKGR